MKKDKVTYLIGTAIGGGLIGFFANKLDTVLGCVVFALGVCLLCFSCYIIYKK